MYKLTFCSFVITFLLSLPNAVTQYYFSQISDSSWLNALFTAYSVCLLSFLIFPLCMNNIADVKEHVFYLIFHCEKKKKGIIIPTCTPGTEVYKQCSNFQAITNCGC